MGVANWRKLVIAPLDLVLQVVLLVVALLYDITRNTVALGLYLLALGLYLLYVAVYRPRRRLKGEPLVQPHDAVLVNSPRSPRVPRP
mgnify:CR=1 FL=1